MKDKIKILHVFHTMKSGGAESMLMNIYRNIDKNIYEFDFVVHSNEKGTFDEEIRSLGGNIHYLPHYKNIIKYLIEWNKLLKRNNYDILHSHMGSVAAINILIARRYGLKTIAHSHSDKKGSGLKYKIFNLITYPTRYISDFYFSCSENAAIARYGKKIVRQKNFFLINNSIDTDIFNFNIDIREQVKKEFNLDNKMIFGHVGNFKDVKNHDFLLDVFYFIHKQNNNTVLMLIGEGELEERIREKVIQLRLTDSVIFCGSRQDVGRLLQAFDLLIFPSKYEGLGLALIEAQATGLKCLVSNTIPAEAYVTDLVYAMDINSFPQEWASKSLEMVSQYDRYGRSNEIIASGFDVKYTSKLISTVYKNMLNKTSLDKN